MSLSAGTIKNIPSQSSTAAEWQNWYDALKNRYGKKTAASIWASYWAKRGSGAADTAQLRDYMKDEGIVVEGGFLSGIADLKLGIGDSMSEFFKWGKIGSLTIAGLIVFSVAMSIWNRRSVKPREAVN